MLILTRRPGESIVIEGGITVRILEGVGGGVRVGITAPGLRVDRAEVHERRKQHDRETPACSP